MEKLEFKIREGGMDDLGKQLIMKSAPMVIIAALLGLGLVWYQDYGEMPILVYVLTLIFISGAVGLGLYIGIKRQMAVFADYKLIIGKDGITREQYNTPSIYIPNAEISEIWKNANGSITIKGDNTLNTIGVPRQIENPDQLELRLTEIKPFSDRSGAPFLERYRTLISFATAILYGAVYLSSNNLIVGICGFLLVGILVYSLVQLQRSKNVDKATKNSMWIVIIVLLSLIANIYTKLSR